MMSPEDENWIKFLAEQATLRGITETGMMSKPKQGLKMRKPRYEQESLRHAIINIAASPI
jgi:hypothetical protein